MTEEQVRAILDGLVVLVKECHANSHDKGFWAEDEEFCEIHPDRAFALDTVVAKKIALIHSELGEALEAQRDHAMSQKVPGVSGLAEELADTMIRIADLAGYMNIPLGAAIVAKMGYNSTRTPKHGRRF